MFQEVLRTFRRFNRVSWAFQEDLRHYRVSQGYFRGLRGFQGVSRHLRLSGFRRSPEAMQGVTEGFTQKVSSGISEAFQKHFGGFSGFAGSFMDVSKISAMFEDF